MNKSRNKLKKLNIILFSMLLLLAFSNIYANRKCKSYSVNIREKKEKTDVPFLSVKFEWNLTIGKENFYDGRDVVMDSYGNIIIAGALNVSKNNYDIFVAKYDIDGNQIWNNTWGQNYSNYGYSLALDSSDNIYVAGYIENKTNSDDRDICLVKYNSTAHYQWNTTFGGKGWDIGYGIAVDSLDNIYIVGYSESVDPNGDVVIIKYNSSGNIEFNKSWGGADNDLAYSVTRDKTDNIYITGYTASFGPNGSNIFLIKYNSSGTLKYNETWGGASIDEGRSLKLDSEGNIYVVGNTKSFGAKEYDIVLLKYNNSGELQWNFTWSGYKDDLGYDIDLDSKKNIYITGTTQSLGDINGNVCLLKFNNSGNFLWNKTFGGENIDIGCGIVLDNFSSIFITGSSNKNICLIKYLPIPGGFALSSNAEKPDTDGTFTLTWKKSSDANNYSVFQYDSYITEINESLSELINESQKLSYHVSGLNEGKYYFIVLSYNNFGNASSDCIKIIVKYPPGAFYLSVNATYPDIDGNFTLSWTLSDRADNYSIYVYNNLITEINVSVIELINGVKNRTFFISNLTTGDYYYAIVAYNKVGNNLSNCVHVLVGRTPLSFKLTSDAENPDIDGSFNLIWTNSEFSINYTIYYSQKLITKINKTVEILEKGLTPAIPQSQYQIKVNNWKDGTYYFIVFAFNKFGNCSSNCIIVKINTPKEEDNNEDSIPKHIDIYFPIYEIIMAAIFASLLFLLVLLVKIKKSNKRTRPLNYRRNNIFIYKYNILSYRNNDKNN